MRSRGTEKVRLPDLLQAWLKFISGKSTRKKKKGSRERPDLLRRAESPCDQQRAESGFQVILSGMSEHVRSILRPECGPETPVISRRSNVN